MEAKLSASPQIAHDVRGNRDTLRAVVPAQPSEGQALQTSFQRVS
jgi:hypothetical protein